MSSKKSTPVCETWKSFKACAYGVNCKYTHDYSLATQVSIAKQLDTLIGLTNNNSKRLDQLENTIEKYFTNPQEDKERRPSRKSVLMFRQTRSRSIEREKGANPECHLSYKERIKQLTNYAENPGSSQTSKSTTPN